MKYTYAYKTSDGQRHEASMDAKCREEVFSALRERGIKAIKVVAADGSKANGEVRGIRKRVFVLCALCLVLCAIAASIMSFRAGEHSNIQTFTHSNISPSAPRHQIYGDPVLVEEFERGHFDPYLTNRLDQLLAYFAQPGKLMCPKGTDPRHAADSFAHELSVLIKSENPTPAQSSVLGKSEKQPPIHFSVLGKSEKPSLTIKSESAPLTHFSVLGKSENFSLMIITENDPREVRELKQIVNGLREEMAAYLANGNGTPRSYWRRLVQRTQQEAQIYERTRRELEHEKSDAVWEQKNDALRLLGLRTIPKTDETE